MDADGLDKQGRRGRPLPAGAAPSAGVRREVLGGLRQQRKSAYPGRQPAVTEALLPCHAGHGRMHLYPVVAQWRLRHWPPEPSAAAKRLKAMLDVLRHLSQTIDDSLHKRARE